MAPFAIALWFTGLFISILLLIGWVMNVVILVLILGDPLTAMTALRLVGIFILPLGGVLGWL